ncbi:glycoside hydrolase family 2 TIM barrel-domain containing protein [Tamlana sp. 2_MG-2023]|uniref:glycoside hydrolase family 2 protein n=1 Tax=unclassified Tamlana TaxID=2614803 RepID=UPI0026E3698A|nr:MULTISPECIES: glycoside hydrolase family 2 TIM barrel-domain containing protein [unclassified Tamlana]MDO6761251.1 glycoside hydrolase family 2 TIM barrel-domain containing protein [Tamlana sp. 2_MG-2023]MDO6791734.1 glycoside hydrolase family 2 TIM barrel-domain containing protein [Tamlana sp. 1_MG-2023]
MGRKKQIMKKAFTILILVMISLQLKAQTLPEGNIKTDRTKTNLNLGWKFHLGDLKTKPTAINFDDSTWESVSIPHTTKLVSYELDSIKETWVQEKYLRDISWYRKKLTIIADTTQKVFIEFEAVHNATELWVNGKKVGNYAVNGYTPFHFDITNFVKFGEENTIAVRANNTFNQTIAPDPHRTDYVKFGGIYRDVYLVTTNKLHVNFNWEDYNAGVHITTPTVNKHNGTVTINTTVKNENISEKDSKIVTKIINKQGVVVKKITASKIIGAHSTYTFRQTVALEEDYHLWSPDSPYLYRVNSVIYDNDTPIDFVENQFGFRKFSLEKGKGFVLNGEPLFLVGVNRHQSYPNIGDAVPNAFHYNEALQYKKAGMNIIRLSHYTQDDAFLQACDELGIFVYEEPSTWIEWGDDTWFENLEKATRTMIRNHRNHPSIIVWGAGINHRGPVPRMQTVAKEEDPFRLTASASAPWNGVKNEGITDIHATMDYRRTEFPESAFTMVMEHGSSPNSEVNQFHISRYKANKNNFAAITWLGADYNHLQPDIVDDQWSRDFMTTYGVLSPYRIPKPVYYWYQSELVSTPMVHIADETASKDGKIRVFSNCQEVELYLDEKLIASKLPDHDITKQNLKHPSFTFRHQWTSGTLKAIGYTNGEKVTEFTRRKAGKPHHIQVEFNIKDQPFYAGGSDIRLIYASILDENGEVVTNTKNEIQFLVSGAGELIDNGKIEANPALVYNGVAAMYVRGTSDTGTITITAKAKGVKSGKASITTIPYNVNEIENNAKPIYDYPIEHVDIGGKEQLVQFDWQAWTGQSNSDLTFSLKDFEAKAEISSNEKINWLGDTAMIGDLSFVGTDGVYVEKGELSINISNLKKGNYQIESFHHSRRGHVKMTNEIEVTVKDANGVFSRKSDDHIVDYYSQNNTSERKPLSITSNFSVNDTNSIQIKFKNLNTEGDLWINGFILKQIN